MNNAMYALIIVTCCLVVHNYIVCNSGAPYPFRKAKENHEFIFLWISWLGVLLVGAHTQLQRQSHARWRPYSPANRSTETYSLGLYCSSLILDIHVMVNWHLSKQCHWPVSHDHIAGSSLELIKVMCFFVLKWTTDQVLVFDMIAGSCLVNLL